MKGIQPIRDYPGCCSDSAVSRRIRGVADRNQFYRVIFRKCIIYNLYRER